MLADRPIKVSGKALHLFYAGDRRFTRNIRDHPPRGILLQFMLIELEKVYGEAKVGVDSFIAT